MINVKSLRTSDRRDQTNEAVGNTLILISKRQESQKDISRRGYTIPQLREKLPKAPGGEEPLPEGLFWLLLTGQIPTEAQVKSVSKAWAQQADLPSHVVNLLNNLPTYVHPMSQLSCAITACNTESKFVKAYNEV